MNNKIAMCRHTGSQSHWISCIAFTTYTSSNWHVSNNSDLL